MNTSYNSIYDGQDLEKDLIMHNDSIAFVKSLDLCWDEEVPDFKSHAEDLIHHAHPHKGLREESGVHMLTDI